MNPFNTVTRSVVTGVILALIITFLVPPAHVGWNELGFARWLHILAGVMWIGLLYYFNAVQTPAMAVAAADKGGPGGAGISKYIAPLALRWFRWAAVVTWLSGAWMLGKNGQFGGVFSLGLGAEEANLYQLILGIGAWLGTIMLFNVWVFIWPAQKKILGLVPATDEQKAKARKVALYASRTNFILSIPMIMCMASAGHTSPPATLPF
jgi:uncharacterized membrane protein